ncbi:hypothetical protein GDO86_020021 [Hymenochirus boettgeri]|uniref:Autophagy-related protein 13 n=1 Tax=Hymenochirus boettgeri TaxID=247094 RepID=A0A8T2II94_9PIPI|nr:hypothetical protein GDO86_020021 [Hymenochirus boettgeri]
MGIIIDHFVDRPFPSTSHMHPCNYRLYLKLSCRGAEEQGLTYPAVEESQEVCTTSFSTSPPSQIVAPGKEGGLPTVGTQPTHGTQADQDRTSASPSNVLGTASSSEEASTQPGSITPGTSSSPNKPPHVLFSRKVGAFVDKPSPQITYASTDIPFAVFAPKLADNEETDPMVVCPESPEEVSPEARSLQSSCSSSGTPQDDFVMVDFKPAFSKDDLPMDVGTFYREFQNPPQLSSLSIDIAVQSMAEDLDSLPEKLAMHEKNMKEFDAFVDSL